MPDDYLPLLSIVSIVEGPDEGAVGVVSEIQTRGEHLFYSVQPLDEKSSVGGVYSHEQLAPTGDLGSINLFKPDTELRLRDVVVVSPNCDAASDRSGTKGFISAFAEPDGDGREYAFVDFGPAEEVIPLDCLEPTGQAIPELGYPRPGETITVDLSGFAVAHGQVTIIDSIDRLL